MSILSKIKRGTDSLPPRIVLAGPEGIGKSTFGSKAPNPLFVCAEDGMTGLDHVERFSPASLDELHGLVDEIIRIKPRTQYQNLVVDTTDWLERLIARSVCERDKKTDIEDYGYGKGYVILENELVKLLQKFDTIRQDLRMGIILLSHVQIRTFNSPEGESYDRYEMKGHKRFTGILREWPDACLFAVNQVFKTKTKGDKREKAIGGERIIHTQWSPAWDAKNRLNLPETLPLEWSAFEEAVNANSSSALCTQIRALHTSAKLAESDKAKWEKFLPRLETLTADKLKAAIEALTNLQ